MHINVIGNIDFCLDKNDFVSGIRVIYVKITNTSKNAGRTPLGPHDSLQRTIKDILALRSESVKPAKLNPRSAVAPAAEQ